MMAAWLCTAVVLSLGQATKSSAAVVVGQVVAGEDGKPLPYATVQVVGRMIGAIAGPQGRYVIDWAPPGNYTFVARYIGYCPGATAAVEVSAADTTRLTFALTLATEDPRGPACPPVPRAPVTSPSADKGTARVENILPDDHRRLHPPMPEVIEGVLVSRGEIGAEPRVDVLTEAGEFRGAPADGSSIVLATLHDLSKGDHVRLTVLGGYCTRLEKSR